MRKLRRRKKRKIRRRPNERKINSGKRKKQPPRRTKQQPANNLQTRLLRAPRKNLNPFKQLTTVQTDLQTRRKAAKSKKRVKKVLMQIRCTE